MKDLLSAINSILQVPKDTQEAIQNKIKFKSISRKGILLKNGSVEDNLYFVRKGLLRGFKNQKRKDITTWFSQEGEFVTSMYSLVSRNPSKECIEALEDCELDYVSYSDLNQLYTSYMELNLLGRVITEKYLIDLEERVNSFQFQSAKSRYQYFIEKHPDLFSRVKLGHIASFLGITKETLSRIRS